MPRTPCQPKVFRFSPRLGRAADSPASIPKMSGLETVCCGRCSCKPRSIPDPAGNAGFRNTVPSTVPHCLPATVHLPRSVPHFPGKVVVYLPLKQSTGRAFRLSRQTLNRIRFRILKICDLFRISIFVLRAFSPSPNPFSRSPPDRFVDVQPNGCTLLSKKRNCE